MPRGRRCVISNPIINLNGGIPANNKKYFLNRKHGLTQFQNLDWTDKVPLVQRSVGRNHGQGGAGGQGRATTSRRRRCPQRGSGTRAPPPAQRGASGSPGHTRRVYCHTTGRCGVEIEQTKSAHVECTCGMFSAPLPRSRHTNCAVILSRN